jgi:hypothetical protein
MVRPASGRAVEGGGLIDVIHQLCGMRADQRVSHSIRPLNRRNGAPCARVNSLVRRRQHACGRGRHLDFSLASLIQSMGQGKGDDLCA